jgi:hypothetical protein
MRISTLGNNYSPEELAFQAPCAAATALKLILVAPQLEAQKRHSTPLKIGLNAY